jgi:hypothetical protein
MWDVIVDGLTEDERDCHVHVGKFVTMTLDYDKMALILIVDDGVRATRSTHKLIS